MTHLALLLLLAFAQDTKAPPETCPMHAHPTANSSHSAMQERGDHTMGFSHDATTHHFRLAPDGGSIEVTANDPKDEANIGAIRSHLGHITMMFGNGNFSAPMFIHDQIPPGVTSMKLLKASIHYTLENLPAGARVRIQSSDPVAVAAIQDFLRFQITDHQTGDPVTLDDPH